MRALAAAQLRSHREYQEPIIRNKIVMLTEPAMPEVAVITPPQLHHVVGHDLKRKERRAVMHSGFSIAADSNGRSHGRATRNR